jgi:hypothetical protein
MHLSVCPKANRHKVPFRLFSGKSRPILCQKMPGFTGPKTLMFYFKTLSGEFRPFYSKTASHSFYFISKPFQANSGRFISKPFHYKSFFISFQSPFRQINAGLFQNRFALSFYFIFKTLSGKSNRALNRHLTHLFFQRIKIAFLKPLENLGRYWHYNTRQTAMQAFFTFL